MNKFYEKRTRLLERENADIEKMMKYISYRTKKSDDLDGGVALFAAIEYWNRGVIFSSKRNKVAVSRKLEQIGWGIPLEA